MSQDSPRVTKISTPFTSICWSVSNIQIPNTQSTIPLSTNFILAPLPFNISNKLLTGSSHPPFLTHFFGHGNIKFVLF